MSRLVVVGEALLDVDLIGTVSRLSPEAPVPVVDDVVEHDRPGGAALAAAMAARDGHDVVLVCPWSDDAAGARLRESLGDGVVVVPLPATGGTPVKRRIMAGDHHVVRLDEGGGAAPSDGSTRRVDEVLAAADAVLVSDYGRGLTHDPVLRSSLEAVGARVPLVWDPHPRGARPVRTTIVVTPNRRELESMSGERAEAAAVGTVRSAAAGAASLVSLLGVRAVAVTLGPFGALLSFGAGPPEVFAARRASGDPCGAGDRFAATVAGALGSGALLSEAVGAGVAMAAEHVATGGAAAFPLAAAAGSDEGTADAIELADRTRAGGGTVVATGGCFDLLHAGHVAMLESAKALGDRLVVLVNSDESVRRLKGASRPLVSVEDRVRVLRSLGCVDAVLVFDEDTPSTALAAVRPHLWVKGGDYAGQRLPEEDALDAWGGLAVVVPYLQGRSTTGLVRAITAG